ncbi:hypothetical protein [Chitinophaga nivalis]|uniref:Phage protein D n=1 Tax=Chitinophaga nivalis TaxID=2991709 RepID=A0ABT3IFD3_9BACT|nr:hypothetical protein [Chitinophaga nivalis]MCW3467641.1 hypothetical protein [Chitinophaga nivalis]MCW3482667.1 hypothetical protein [Chitinophaga nivalis]
MFKLTCQIIIGSYSFTQVNEVKIKRSIHSFVDTASIKIPATARLHTSGDLKTVSVNNAAASFMNEGDPVEIWLGYNQELQLEFSGFVKRVNAATPCEIECEGYSWPLRRKIILQNFKGKTLQAMLEHATADTGIRLSENIPNIKLNQCLFENQNGTEVLDWIKKNLFLTVYFSGNVLYAGLAYVELPQIAQAPKEGRKPIDGKLPALTFEREKQPVRYDMGWNVIKDDQLKFRKAADVKLQIRAVTFDKNNTPVTASFGDSKDPIRTIFVPYVSAATTLRELAAGKLNELKYDGYEGKITTFLQPFSQPGTEAKITDRQYKEREGTYLLESTEVTFGTGGARRICEVGVKISKKDEQTTGTVAGGTAENQ